MKFNFFRVYVRAHNFLVEFLRERVKWILDCHSSDDNSLSWIILLNNFFVSHIYDGQNQRVYRLPNVQNIL